MSKYPQLPMESDYVPPSAPPTYAQAVGGVPPCNPYTPNPASMKSGTPLVTTVVSVGPESTHMICPHCRAEINTSTTSEPGKIAYLIGTILFLLGCSCGCCLIPCCMQRFRNIQHTCPNCQSFIGTYQPIR